METTTTLFIVLFIWLLGLSGFLFWFTWVLRGLLKDSKNKDFIKAFKKIEDIQIENSKEIESLGKKHGMLVDNALDHVQSIGLVKYNPFSETGGDHSFSLALLDGKKNGIIITSLHTRESTRVYIKDVKNCKTSIELSTQESKALKKAIK
ncbi:DUF4446 family protein [Candidatus Microgenomates bacterium]|nr:DUF4446 family protein [Candidatus Microgenomates bacterium]